jgi:hypothetical protein
LSLYIVTLQWRLRTILLVVSLNPSFLLAHGLYEVVLQPGGWEMSDEVFGSTCVCTREREQVVDGSGVDHRVEHSPD